MTSIVQSLTLPHVLSDEEDLVEFVDDEDDEVVQECRFRDGRIAPILAAKSNQN